MSVRSETVDEELQELRVTVQALRQQNASLEKRLQEALMKIEVLNLKKDRAKPGPYTEKGGGQLKSLPETSEELRWQLLTTLRLLRRSELAREEVEQRLRKLVLLADDAVKSAEKVDPKKRGLLEAELRDVQTLLGPRGRRTTADTGDEPGEFDPVAMKKAKVLEFRQDLSLAVVSVGRQQGVRLGMPFDIVRSDRLIATAVVVEVRENLCGVLIERMEKKNPVKPEDQAVLRKS